MAANALICGKGGAGLTTREVVVEFDWPAESLTKARILKVPFDVGVQARKLKSEDVHPGGSSV